MDGHSPIGVINSPRPSRDPSQSLQDPGEHDDSPMRKKPRLDSGDMNSAAIPQDASSPIHSPGQKELSTNSTSPAAMQTPSKVTLNLRTYFTDTSAFHPAAEPSSDSSKQKAGSPPSSPGSLDVEIEADEPEEIGDDEYDSVISMTDAQSFESHLIAQFPYVTETGPADIVKQFGVALGGDTDIELNWLRDIAQWLLSWLDHIQDRRVRWHAIYAGHREFWENIAIMVCKFTARRGTLGNPFAKHPDGSRSKILQRFFGFYLQLCGHFIYIDLDNLTRTHADSVTMPELVSGRHLKAMDLIFRSTQDVHLWNTLSHRNHIDVDVLQLFLANKFLHIHSQSLEDLIQLTDVLSRSVHIWPKVGLPLVHAVRSLSNLCHQFALIRERPRSNPGNFPLFASFAKKCLAVVETIQKEFHQNIAKQTSAIPVAVNQQLVENAGHLLYRLVRLDEETGSQAFQCQHGTVQGVEPHDYADILQNSLTFSLWWRFLAKGRMELRVLGASRMDEELLILFRRYTRPEVVADDLKHPVMQSVADLLVRERIVEYIVGVDSHPQLISRSSKTAGFLIVTDRWTQELTDTIWNTITSSQDPRIVTATLGLLMGQMELEKTPYLDLCEKINALPFTAFTSEMMDFARSLIEHLRLWEDYWSGFRMIPYRLCVRIIRDALVHQLQTGSNVTNIKDTAFRMLQKVSEIADRDKSGRISHGSLKERKEVYADCIKDVLNQTQTAAGSLDSIYALLSKHTEDDMTTLIEDMDLLRIVAEDFCYFAKNQRGRTQHQFPYTELEARLKLFTYLIIYGPTTALPLELERKLWSHLVGKEAIDDYSRDQAWSYLCEIVQKCNESRPLIDRCTHDYLPNMEPSLLTKGLFGFVEAAMPYRQRVSPPGSPVEMQVVQIPLADLLWQIILTAPENTVEMSVISLMSQQHLDTALIKKAPKSAVAATHAALVTRCITQLEEAASNLAAPASSRRDKHNKSITTDHEELNASIYELRFRRTLQFLRQFLADIKERPSFKSPLIVAKSPTPPTPASPEMNGSPIDLKYQVFNGPSQKEVRELKIGSLETFAELSERFRILTGFTDISVILGGKKIDLALQPMQTVDVISGKGLLLVRNVGHRLESPKSENLAIGGSVAEQTILAHFDKLYELLNLKKKQSHAVFDFLMDFPPHNRVRDLVMLEDTPLIEMFPIGKPFKTLYSFKALKQHLQQQLKAGINDETFILHGVKLLTIALTNSNIITLSLETAEHREITFALVDCLLAFLKERPLHGLVASQFTNEATMIDRLFSLLASARTMPALPLGDLICSIYGTIVEASLHSRKVWEAFSSKPTAEDIHCWLLIENSDLKVRAQVRNSIEGVCQSTATPIAVQPQEFVHFYWKVISKLIPYSIEHSRQSSELLATAASIFPCREDVAGEEATLRGYLIEWGALLLKHVNMQVVGRDEVDDFLLGLSRLLSLCVYFLKSYKQPINAGSLMDDVFTRFLFPPINDEGDEKTSPTPVLDAETRKELYGLTLSLCEDTQSYETLVYRLSTLVSEENTPDPRDWQVDRTKFLRSSAGYAGLRNLTNTCYMNSLITQLFVNIEFRKFLLAVNVTDANGQQKLLAETQKLFAHMQNNSHRFAETSLFAESIRPYEGEHIDVSIQMDVDEFYNLLFDRWEGQILGDDAKKQFRSVFGGQLVTQIKSRDCGHVSEREEKFMAIQCEVRGKASLAESLTAYVEGDFMEGDNKYKCESCDGRLVNAVKRACLKHVPENLIFHLKRFDFDYTTLQRHKVNDRFEFPTVINMKQYTVNYLNDPEGHHNDDMFELSGVLVHSGSAETGHYYSYTRVPGIHPDDSKRWVEFNDTEVSDFDPNKIPDQCFGGEYDTPQQYSWPKFYNAYMLFYQRVSSGEVDRTDNRISVFNGLIELPMPAILSREIRQQNEKLVRRYCLFSSSHAAFVKTILSRLKERNAGVCSESHEIEKNVISMVLYHITQVFTRAINYADFESTLVALKKTISSSPQCCALTLEWITDHPLAAQNMWLSCPIQRIRLLFAEFVRGVLFDLRGPNPLLYGLDTTERNFENLCWSKGKGVFPKMVGFAKNSLPELGKNLRIWDDYFSLWFILADLGLPELAVLLAEGVFADCIETLYIDQKNCDVKLRDHHQATAAAVRKSKLPLLQNTLIRLIGMFLKNLNPYVPCANDEHERLRRFDEATQRFPLTRLEYKLVHLWDRPSQQSHLLGKIIDGWDINFDGMCCPGEIVHSLLEANPPDRDSSNIAVSIMSAIDQYVTQHVGTVLNTALFFCMKCPNRGYVLDIVNAAASNVLHIENSGEPRRTSHGIITDFVAQGGGSHLEFFKALVQIEKPAWSPELERPFLEVVISHAPQWGPALLMFDDKNVRENTRGFLEEILFDRFPCDYPADDSDDPGSDDIASAKAVGGLFQKCYDRLVFAFRGHYSRSLMMPTIRTLQSCADWAGRLADARGNGYAEMRRELDCDEIVAKWLEAKDKLPEGRDDDADDGYTDTEYENGSNFDDESDDLTEG